MADEVRVQCVVDHVFTSKGKIEDGMTATLPADEAKFLAGRKQVKILTKGKST